MFSSAPVPCLFMTGHPVDVIITGQVNGCPSFLSTWCLAALSMCHFRGLFGVRTVRKGVVITHVTQPQRHHSVAKYNRPKEHGFNGCPLQVLQLSASCKN